ncbi:uncharacterized protein BJ212DRAFT_1490954 [Suillus subaureus]|uniref:Uncharacterized protein n=1 Tax=Suillus subaureus TaxID=48587 RepID=A0A9P7DGC8_9AGAM|nr:uncharacterized protein BJ212DRAFT_1490954 [Suillus subaureus]KAG1791504.1 hypothetical protein BJ212DRAFT_1490954 [Suillus subaureus]
MARITSDLALDIQPDFTSPTFEALRDCIIGGTQALHQEVAADLTTAWQQDWDNRSIAWVAQVNEDARLTAEAAQTAHEHTEHEHLHLEQETEDELQEAEKKKPR